MNNDFESRSTSQGGFLAGLLCGAAVGAALGVVFAPRSGAETRQQLADSTGRLRETANRTYTQASEGVSQLVSRGREAVDRGREAFDRTRDKATDGRHRDVHRDVRQLAVSHGLSARAWGTPPRAASPLLAPRVTRRCGSPNHARTPAPSPPTRRWPSRSSPPSSCWSRCTSDARWSCRC